MLTLPSRWSRLVPRVAGPCLASSGAARLRAFEGTLSRSMPRPGNGLTPITSTVGSVADAASEPGAVCAATAPGSSSAAVRAAILVRRRYAGACRFRLFIHPELGPTSDVAFDPARLLVPWAEAI